MKMNEKTWNYHTESASSLRNNHHPHAFASHYFCRMARQPVTADTIRLLTLLLSALGKLRRLQVLVAIVFASALAFVPSMPVVVESVVDVAGVVAVVALACDGVGVRGGSVDQGQQPQ